MYGFPDVPSANEYVQSHLWLEAQTGVTAFWALHGPADGGNASDAVVIVRDPHHPGIVQLYSFVNMDAALAFIRQEFRNGIDLNLVLVYWAEQVDVERPPALASGQAPDRAYFATPPIARRVDAVPAELRPKPAIRVDEKPKQMDQRALKPESEGEAATAARSRLSETVEQITSWPGWDGLVPRMVQAATLKEEVYEEAERDKHALGRGRVIFALAIFATGIGALAAGPASVVWQMMFAAAGWMCYAAIIYFFGTEVLGGRKTPKTFRNLVKTLGLAASPGIFLVLGIIPTYGAIPVLGVYIWVFLTTVHAIPHTLELDNQSSVVLAAIGALTLFGVSQVLPIALV
jgi:hypothetical protein